MKNLCLAGGVALNCVANGKVLRDGRFDDIWIQPAAGDAGGALGAALGAYHLYKDQPRAGRYGGDAMRGGYLGPAFRASRHRERLTRRGRPIRGTGRRRADRRRRPGARRRQGARLVPGRHGVRPPGAGCALDPRRRAVAEDAEDAQPEGQVPRIVPSLRALGAAGRRQPTGSSWTATAPTCCWSRTSPRSAAGR